eukprot:5666074-Amphidinium_carterae.1
MHQMLRLVALDSMIRGSYSILGCCIETCYEHFILQWDVMFHCAEVDLDGDLRRLPNFNPYGINDTLVSYETIAHSVSQLYGLPAAMAQTLVLKYRDDEGDMCTLVPSTVQDAVRPVLNP